MRILHVDTGRELRGGQYQLLLLLRGLEARGHQQVLLARKPLLEHWPGLEVSAGNLWRAGADVDLIHAHDARGHTLALLRSVDKPLVVSRRVAFPIGRGRLSRWKYSRARYFIAVSDHVRQELLDSGVPRRKIAVIHDGVELPSALPEGVTDRNAPSGGHSPKVIAPRIDDPLKGSGLLQAACESIGLQPAFSSDLPADLAAADVFAYLSETEGLGSAILLAMAHRVPVVASRVGGVPEIVEHEATGLLVENRVEDVAGAIRRLIDDQAFARACAERAFRQVCERFSDDIMVRQTEQIYHAVLGL